MTSPEHKENAEELLPCAHCGGTPMLKEKRNVADRFYFVACDDCWMQTHKWNSKKFPITCWNTRPAPVVAESAIQEAGVSFEDWIKSQGYPNSLEYRFAKEAWEYQQARINLKSGGVSLELHESLQKVSQEQTLYVMELERKLSRCRDVDLRKAYAAIEEEREYKSKAREENRELLRKLSTAKAALLQARAERDTMKFALENLRGQGWIKPQGDYVIDPQDLIRQALDGTASRAMIEEMDRMRKALEKIAFLPTGEPDTSWTGCTARAALNPQKKETSDE